MLHILFCYKDGLEKNFMQWKILEKRSILIFLPECDHNYKPDLLLQGYAKRHQGLFT